MGVSHGVAQGLDFTHCSKASACHSTASSYLRNKLKPTSNAVQICVQLPARDLMLQLPATLTLHLSLLRLRNHPAPHLQTKPPPPLDPEVMPDELFTAIQHLNDNRFPGVCSIDGVNGAEVRRWLCAFCTIQSHPWRSEQTPYMKARNTTYYCALIEHCTPDVYVALAQDCRLDKLIDWLKIWVNPGLTPMGLKSGFLLPIS